MPKRYLFALLTLLSLHQVKAQYISEILEYKPAPGQFINTSGWGLPPTANTLVGGLNGGVSLGAFGGYITFKFSSPVENHPDNPYGVDFVIYGNPLKNLSTPALNNNVTWAEPGIVSVMKDENGNGLPDDTWYELAGSDYFFSTTQRGYEVTYTNPGGSAAADVPWMDNLGNTGFVYANTFHSQPYYPQPESFPNVDATRYTLGGTRVKDFVDRTIPTFITAAGRPWGYVDNNLRNAYNGKPDNPYTDNVEEGSGGDAFDISWAVDAEGNYVDLDRIHFVKVHSATLADAGWLGEMSTEVAGAFVVLPDASITGWDSTSLVLNNIPIQVSAGKAFQLEAVLFVKGRKVDVADMAWTASPAGLVSIDANNVLTTTGVGTVTITASCSHTGIPHSESMITTIIAPATVDIAFDQAEVQVGQKYPISAAVKDQNGGTLQGLECVWETSNSKVAVQKEDDRTYLAALEEGSAWVYAHPSGYPDIRDSVEVSILKAADSISVYLTIKTDKKMAVHPVRVKLSNFELTPFVSNPHHAYGLSDVVNVTAAHAVASVFENVLFESDLRFKDTEDKGLYIHKLPVRTGSQITYHYGYGNGDASKKSCWMVNIGNKTHFNSLETVRLFENDSVVAYYVSDITAGWKLYNLTASATEINAGAPVEIALTQENLFLYSGTTVMSEGSAPAEGKAVYVNGEALLENGDTLRTNSEGKATLFLADPGSYTVAVATEQLNLAVAGGTGIQKQGGDECTVYPNPANDWLSVQAPALSGKVDIQVYSLTGQRVASYGIDRWAGSYELNTAAWSNGFYLLRVVFANAVWSKRIIVRH